jgi:filamentous hemagglutinin family protein
MKQVKRSLFLTTLPLYIIGCFAYTGTVRAQVSPDIVPDNSLGAESSQITTVDPIDLIEGGATRGANLFHSFENFNIRENRGAFFVQPSGIQNIISRVTGRNASNINGTLGVIDGNINLGSANLFFLNPNGIIFGPNARLLMGGSFVASTASSLLFNGLEEFRVNPQESSLLSINIPIGLRFRENPGRIQVQGNGQGLRATPDLIDTTDALRVQADKTLALVGGDVSLEGATLKTAGGRIELGSVAGEGLVNLSPTNKGFSLNYRDVQNFGNIQLSQQTAVDASGAGGGDIQVVGRRITLTNGSRIEASTLGSQPGGSLVVNGLESVELSGTAANSFLSGLFTDVYQGATGTGGELSIDTRELTLRDGAQVRAITFGAGDAGNLTIANAQQVELIGTTADGLFPSGLFTQTQGDGNAKDLTINTRELIVRDGAQVNAGTFGAGDGGNLLVTATDRVELIGTATNGNPSGLFTPAQRDGNAKDLTINTRELIVRDGAQVNAGTFGAGDGGNLLVTATDRVELIGTVNNFPSGLFTQTLGDGDAKDLTVNTRELIVRNGAVVSAGTFGAGDGGNLFVTATDKVQLSNNGGLFAQADPNATGNAKDLTINTRELIVRNGAQVSAGTLGAGDGGNLFVSATGRVELIGTATNGNPSGLFTQQNTPGATGNAKDLTINTRELIVRDGAKVSSSTVGQGNAGKLTVANAERIELIGENSGLFAQVGIGATGNGGDLEIDAKQLFIQNGAQVNASTLGEGDAGNLTIANAERVELIGTSADGLFPSSLFTNTYEQATGKAGNLSINTRELILRDGAQVGTSTFGAGDSGNLIVTADNVQLIGASTIGRRYVSGLFTQQNTPGATGNAKDLTINTRELIVQNGAQVSAGTQGAGDGGNLFVTATEKVHLSNNGGLFAQADPNSTGNAGNLTISTPELIVRDGAQVNTNTYGEGNAGNLSITNAERIELIGSSTNGSQFPSALFTNAYEQATGNAGNLTINTRELIVRDGAQVAAFTFGAGDAGNLTIANAQKVELIGTSADGEFPSALFTNAYEQATGNAGDLSINTRELIVRDGAQVGTITFGAGDGGNMTVTADSIKLIGASTVGPRSISGLLAQQDTFGATGNAGDVTINTRDLLVQDRARVSVQNFGTGTAGNLTIDARSIRLDKNAILTAATRSNNTDPNIKQGNININARDFVYLRRGSQITANAEGEASGGNINIFTSNLIGSGNSDITANALNSSGGRITINAQGLFGFVPRTRAELQQLLPANNLDPTQLPTSDITAVSQNNPDLSGQVNISTPDVDPSQGLVDLPETVIDPSQQIAQNPCQRGIGSSFVVTGRGGIPSSPNQAISSDNVRVDLLEPVASQGNSNRASTNQPSTAAVKQIVPAQGWIFNDKGEVVLTAYDPTKTGSPRPWKQSAGCAVR